jgi:arginine deiminase
MTLSEEARERLADVVELQPTKNAELQERWGMESGSEVHQYLESELGDYYYRDDNSLIRATEEAADLVDVEPGVSDNGDGSRSVRVPELHAQVFEVLAEPDERSQSVVSVLQDLRETFGIDPSADEVRDALQSLKRKGVVEVVYRTVPTYKLALDRESVEVSVSD